MNKFNKAVTASALSFGLTGGMLAIGGNIDHIQNQDRRACLEQLDGAEKETCLSEVSQNSNTEQLLEFAVLAGMLGAVASGVQAYRALNKEE